MKKVLGITLIVFFLALAFLFATPFLYKQKMLTYAQNILNKQLNAKVEFSDLKLSLIRNFPKLSLNLTDVVIKGIDYFENDTLLYVPSIRTSTNIGALFNPSNMSINEFIVNKAKINLLINKEGEENWNLIATKNSDTPENNTKEEKNNDDSDFKLSLDKIEFTDTDLKYIDEKTNISLTLNDISFNVGGKMYGNNTSLNAKADVQDIALDYSGTNYVSKTLLNIKTKLDADFDAMSFEIGENELLINRLPLELNGMVKITGDTVFCDMEMEAKATSFEDFLALLPSAYEAYLKDITTKGTASIKGTAKGFYFEEDYPTIQLHANINDAMFKYADMPEEINNISANIDITKQQGILDDLTINVSKAHAEIRETPVDFKLRVDHPVSDPYFDGTLIGQIDLSQLKKTLPLDSVNMSGIIDANLVARGNYSAIEKEAYDQIKSDGIMQLSNFEYNSPDFTQKILIPKGKLDFSPQQINLSEFAMQIGQSDFNLSGAVRNYLNYLLKDGTLNADLRLNSKKVNINELMNLQSENFSEDKKDTNTKKDEDTDNDIDAFDIPDHINITFRSNIASAEINRIPISNINGLIKAANKKLSLQNLNMDMLKGRLQMNGSYQNSEDNKPLFDFGFNILDFDIPTMFQTLSGFRKLAPVAKNSTGLLNSNMKISGQLNERMKAIPASINGDGYFGTKNLTISNSSVFEQLNGIIAKNKLKNIVVDDFKANAKVENGNLLLQPFKTKIIGQETEIEGSLSVDNIIDMRLDFEIERDAFGPDIQKILSVIPGNEKIKKLPAGVNITGSAEKPKVSPDLSKTTKAVAKATKDDIKKTIGEGLMKLLK